MGVVGINVPTQQHRSITSMCIVTIEALLLGTRCNMLLHYRPLVACEAQFALRHRQLHFKRVALGPGRVAKVARDLAFRVHRLANRHVRMTRITVRILTGN